MERGQHAHEALSTSSSCQACNYWLIRTARDSLRPYRDQKIAGPARMPPSGSGNMHGWSALQTRSMDHDIAMGQSRRGVKEHARQRHSQLHQSSYPKHESARIGLRGTSWES
jgi:hypothetical protein